MADEPILRVQGLNVAFGHAGPSRRVVRDVSLDLWPGRTLALVGESGCGKSVTALAMMSLLSPPGRVLSGSIVFGGQDLVGAEPRTLERLRGDRLAMVFQEPMSALNPVMRIGAQVAEPLRVHRTASKAQARTRAIELLRQVGIAEPEQCARAYPHELSGGMRQRVLIATAMACNPAVLIADEPTTALDATTQSQVLELLTRLQRATGMAMLFVTHDLALVQRVADNVAVMYAGRIAEQGAASELVERPRHPYTAALWRSSAAGRRVGERLYAIPGHGPPAVETPGCAFAPRCSQRAARCDTHAPPLESGVACFYPIKAPVGPEVARD